MPFGRRALVLACACVSLLLVMGCGDSDTGGPKDATAELPPTVDTGPVTDCTDLPADTECDDGNPCTSGDTCDGQGSCIAATTTVCEDVDNNPCTNPTCDPDNGDPANGYCTEAPLVSETVEDVCYTYQCADGVATGTEPSTQNDCADWEISTGGCIDQYVCDPQYEAAQGGSHCRPVGKVDGTPCLNEGVGVKAGSSAAATDETSDCLLYVCHQQDAPNTALIIFQCVLSSTLPEDVQQTMEEAGHKLRHVCSLDDSPETVSLACNDWRCGCKDESCAEPECQVDPMEAKVGKPCDNGNVCDASACMPAKGAGAVMECEGVADSEVACDLFPNATCDVSGPCDPATGCPTAMDVDASDANCLVNSLCIDPFNTKCAPNNPDADPVTGCVVYYEDVGTPCTAALKEKDACVTEALCESKEGTILCKPTAWVDCEDGNACTDNVCNDGACEQTNQPGACDDADACTANDTCADGLCKGTPVDCDDGFVCTADSCDSKKGCEYVADDTLCDDANGCTDNGCTLDGGCVFTNNTASCDDEDACTTQDACADGGCQGGPALVCDNGLFCDGQESCDTAKGCQNGSVPAITDLVGCTIDYCDEDNDKIVHTPDDNACDNGLFCDGAESCDVSQGCVNGTPPPITDLVGCTVDHCDEDNDIVVHNPDDSACDNTLYCDGVETCDATKGCQNGAPPSTDDSVACTVDTCDEANDKIVHTPDDNACDNTLYCDGVESCDVSNGCLNGTPPSITDLVGCTVDSCDEDHDKIVHTPSDDLCDDGQFCTGIETCNATQDCQSGQPPVVDDGFYCTVDSCDEDNDQVVHIAQDISCDDSDNNTKDDQCEASGECKGTPYSCAPTQCEVSSTPNGTDCTVVYQGTSVACDDGDAATKTDQCDGSGGCDGTTIACMAASTCTPAWTPNGTDCDPTHADDGNACNDNDLSTATDQCDGSGGCAGTPYTCTPTQCETSSTPNGTDCTVVYHENSCDDGNVCTWPDTCSVGVCVPGPQVSCNDFNPCTNNTCNNPGGCSTTNKAPGTPCAGGVCNNGSCVTCIPGQTGHCNPQCGAFNGSSDGYRTCVNSNWGECKPVKCAPGNPTYYQAVPTDTAWHCGPWAWPNAFTMYLCLKATTVVWCGSPTIEFELKKASNMSGSNFGPFDNNVSISLRNVNNGWTMGVPSVSCAGQWSCTFTVGVSELINSLGLNGTNSFEATMYSPPGGTYIGNTGQASLVKCY